MFCSPVLKRTAAFSQHFFTCFFVTTTYVMWDHRYHRHFHHIFINFTATNLFASLYEEKAMHE